ncbi:hypothetical protein RD110_03695 [Rhodoferax koreense]|uniref:LemA family protein n=1 Tax=Rhodoferax koreensis TaxID=1842727 RepID=A0A1P8JRN7_9BURK|nr:hypothetical protein [Rhodoferax koreense]APW36416.1 hypothetical protein RD110_03695 [Rhodoferax koreense]
MISGHLLGWSIAAVLLFWGVGAYNRLVRLRSEALRAFTLLEPKLQRFTEHVVAAAPLPADVQGAATQFAASLAVARIKPLDAEAMAALGAACAVLQMAWRRAAEAADTADTVSGPQPWADIYREAGMAAREFTASVLAYNAAVTQFPAALLAWLFGFRKAQPLALPPA